MRTAVRLISLVLLACNNGSGEATSTETGGATSTGTAPVTTTGEPGETTVTPPTGGDGTSTTSTGPGVTTEGGETGTTDGPGTSTTTTGLTATSSEGSSSSTGEPLPCLPGQVEPCYSGAPETEDVGACVGGLSTCDEQGVPGPCEGEVLPGPESCDTPGDEDCDGVDPCAGEGEYVWHKVWGSSGDERGVRLGFDGAGALYLASQGSGTADFGGGPLVSAGSWDLYLAKFAADGTHVWSKRFGDQAAQFGDGWALAVEPDGDFVVAGGYQGKIDLGGGPLMSQSIADVFIGKLTGDGAHVWSKTYKAGSYALPQSLALDGDGEVYLGGLFTTSLDLGGGMMASAGAKDGFVGKFTADGAHVWSLRFGDVQDQSVYAVTVDPAGDATVGGAFRGAMNPGNGQLVSAGTEDAFVVQFDPIGNAVWAKKFGDAGFQQVLAITRADDGRITAAGLFEGAVDFGGGMLMSGSPTGFVAQFEPDGAHVWSKRLADGSAVPQGIDADALGSLILTGYFTGMNDFGGGNLTSEGDHDIFAVKLGPTGNHVWSQRFGDNKLQDGLAAAAASSGRMAITGGYVGAVNFGGGPSNSQGAFDGFVAVFGP